MALIAAVSIWLALVFALAVWYDRRDDELRRSRTEALRRILNDPRVSGTEPKPSSLVFDYRNDHYGEFAKPDLSGYGEKSVIEVHRRESMEP